MSSLIELNEKYKDILNTIQSLDGEIPPNLELELTQLLIESKDKVSGYCLILDRYEFEINFTKEQIKKAKEYIDRLEYQKSKLEKIALDVVNSRGSKLEGNSGRWINKRKSTKLNVFDPDLVPPVYSKIEVKLDNAKIKEDLQRGIDIPGAVIEENLNLSWK